MNGLQMIVRAHECVMDGFERFAQGHLLTLFSATNYCGTAGNAGAILVRRGVTVSRPHVVALRPLLDCLPSVCDMWWPAPQGSYSWLRPYTTPCGASGDGALLHAVSQCVLN